MTTLSFSSGGRYRCWNYKNCKQASSHDPEYHGRWTKVGFNSWACSGSCAAAYYLQRAQESLR